MASSKLTNKVVSVVMGFGLLPVLVVTAVTYYSLRGLRGEESARVSEHTRILAEGIDREIGDAAESLRIAASVPLPGQPEVWFQKGADNPLVPILNRFVLETPGAELSMLVGLKGNVMGASSVDGSGHPNRSASLYRKSFADAPWFQSVVDSKYLRPHEHRSVAFREHGAGVVIAEPTPNPVLASALGHSAEDTVVMVTPVQSGTQVVGYWVSYVQFSHIEETVERLAGDASRVLGGQAAVTLIGASGQIILEYDPQSFAGAGFNRDREVVGTLQLASTGSQEAQSGETGVVEGDHRVRGGEQVVGYTHLRGNAMYPGMRWSVLVQVPTSDLYSKLDRVWEALLVALIVSIPVLLLGGVMLGHQVARPILAVANSAKPMANGDFSGEVPITGQGEVATMGRNLNDIAVSMSRVLGNVQQTSEQIIGTSSEVSGASSALADNASRSAAALEEISASMATLSKQTKANAESATSALDLATAVSDQADESTSYMQQMVESMDEISVSSERISQIIKVIDEIAFQTNLLALNAAVEAARAGQHGKGFAVVAEEVRTLAARSAKAARETNTLIQDSLAKVGQGSDVARKTADSLGEIVEGIGRVSSLMTEVASASSEQAGGISEIDVGLIQVDNGVQGNTASAEELAASARELSARAYELEEVVAGLSLREVGFGSTSSSFDEDDGEFGEGESFGASGVDEFGISVGAATPEFEDDGGYDDFGF
ncbi:MAG: hypothetical protein GY811_12910 [Myxococcales bacterium]|nr:hypothetical protein [Myxococcales bacterium]